jgi:hypothetical protein
MVNAVLPSTADIVAAGEEAFSAVAGQPCRFVNPVRLGGSERSVVLRVEVSGPGAPATVVLKAHPTDGSALSEKFLDEAAGLAFSGKGPALLAVDAPTAVLVLEDLGSPPSLADLLLADDPERAAAAATAWATEFGRLCAESAGREAEFGALRQRFGGEPANPQNETWLPRALRQVSSRFGALGVELPAGLDVELVSLLVQTEPGDFAVFSPGDVCPDNNLLTPEGLRFIDFEGAGYHSVFLDAAYTRLPFATCWCVFTPPPGLTGVLEAAFRAEVVRVFPALADDAVWDAGVRQACAVWVLTMSLWLLPGALENDAELAPAGGRAPRRRPYLAHRWRWLADELERAGELPAVTALMRGALANAAERWAQTDLVLLGYPAFRAAGKH